jgi:hypothetical protein
MPDDKRPKFTRQHYKMLADALAGAVFLAPERQATGVWLTVGTVTNMLEKDNPNFDRARFHEAIDKAADNRLI